MTALKRSKKRSMKVRLTAKNVQLREMGEKVKAAEKQSRMARARVGSLHGRLEAIEVRYRAVLGKIQAANGDEYIERLCDTSLAAGAKVGTIEWSFCSRVLDNPRVTGFCEWCSISCYGAEKLPEVMPCNVPGCPYEAAAQQKPFTVGDLGHILDARDELS